MTRITIATVVALACASPCLAQQRPITELDVAGVRLDATADDARAALLRNGYRIRDTQPTSSFEQEVAQEVARRQRRAVPFRTNGGVSSIHATGPHQESMVVQFHQRAGGSRVSEVTVQVPPEAMTAEAFRDQVAAKYGKPHAVRDQGLTSYWCSPEVARVCGVTYVPEGPLGEAYPMLTARTGIGSSLRLSAGSEAEKVARRERDVAVERLAPKTDRAAF